MTAVTALVSTTFSLIEHSKHFDVMGFQGSISEAIRPCNGSSVLCLPESSSLLFLMPSAFRYLEDRIVLCTTRSLSPPVSSQPLALALALSISHTAVTHHHDI